MHRQIQQNLKTQQVKPSYSYGNNNSSSKASNCKSRETRFAALKSQPKKDGNTLILPTTMDSSSSKQMNDYWHIPRASLAPSSNSSAVSSASSSNRSHRPHSNPPTVSNRVSQPQHQRQYKAPVNIVGGKQKRRDSDMSATSAAATAAAAAAVLAAATAAVLAAATAAGAKRGSRSSQGSSGSNNSTRSAASGSLLLTAANLERFAEIHKKQQKPTNKLLMAGVMPTVHNSNTAATTTVTTTTPTPTIYNANLVHAIMQQQQHHQQQSRVANGSHSNSNNDDNDIIITMDPNLDFIKTKDLDSVSIASSMHFTMVNGENDKTNPRKRGLCDRGRQVTVLITSMSLLFLLLIMGMVYALEMRAREMPQS